MMSIQNPTLEVPMRYGGMIPEDLEKLLGGGGRLGIWGTKETLRGKKVEERR